MAWSLPSLIRERAKGDSESVLLIQGERSVAAGELDVSSNQIGSALVRAGCNPGDRVAIINTNSIEYYEILFGAAKAGVIAVPMNWRLGLSEMTYVLEDSCAKVVFLGSHTEPLGSELVKNLSRDVILVGLGKHYQEWRTSELPIDPGFEPGPEDDAVQIYTSGTTGAAKGVVLPNSAIEASLAHLSRFALDDDSVALVNLPQFHFGGTVWPLWTWAAGGACVLHERFDADLVVKEAQERVTNLITVPSMLRMMCDSADVISATTFKLRRIGYGSAPITEALLKRATGTFGCDFVQSYASTETCGIVSQLLPEEHYPNGSGGNLLRSVGRPIPGTEVMIGDARSGSECSPGTVGPIWVRSRMNMSGYWRKPEVTASISAPGGWIRTGDLGYRDTNGYLYLADRAGEMIITGGENVYPSEVENVVAAHPGVEDVVVVGVPDERWGEMVTAVIVRRPGHEVSRDDLMMFCRERISHFKAPRRIEFVEDLPKNETGKLLRRDVRDSLSPERCA